MSYPWHANFKTALNERPDAPNATQKTPALNKVEFLKKSWITSKFFNFFTKTAKNGNFWRYFWIFSETILCLELGGFVLRLVHQDASFELCSTVKTAVQCRLQCTWKQNTTATVRRHKRGDWAKVSNINLSQWVHYPSMPLNGREGSQHLPAGTWSFWPEHCRGENTRELG